MCRLQSWRRSKPSTRPDYLLCLPIRVLRCDPYMDPASSVLGSSVLVLNRLYQPVNITTVRRAFILLYQGTAKAIDRTFQTFDFESWSALSAEVHGEADIVKTVSKAIRVPRVII